MRSGEVWLVELEPTRGAEIGKIRPVIIINRDAIGILPLKVIIPLTRWQERYNGRGWMVKIEPTNGNGLIKPSVADTFQIRSVSQERLRRKLGTLSDKDMTAIANALLVVLQID